MNIKNCLLGITVLLSCQSRNYVAPPVNAFDPMLDAKCQVLQVDKGEKWPGAYMWHPGQLAAWVQADNLRRSKERCVYVDYPGKYYAMSRSTRFQTTTSLNKATTIEWRASGKVQVLLDDREIEVQDNSASIPAGQHQLTMQVDTQDRVPALIVRGGGLEDSANWMASTHPGQWVPAESDARLCYPDVLPDDPQELQVCIPHTDPVSLQAGQQQLIDFRYLELGQVKMHISGQARLTFVVGESPAEAQNTAAWAFEQSPLDTLTIAGEQDITLPERALRYLNITALEGECTISQLRMDAAMWPVEYQMDFTCDDEELNQIFQASIATMHTCMHNFYLDGVKRDFLPWALDATLSSIGANHAFGDQQLTRNAISISLMAEDPTQADLGVIDYPLHALLGLQHEYMRFGQLRTSLMFQQRIIRQMQMYMDMQDEHGFISDPNNRWGFIAGWNIQNGPDHQGIPAYAQMLLMQNFRIAASFATLWEKPELAQRYTQRAEQLQHSIRECFWDQERRVFINGYYADGTRDERISHHTLYWAVLTGLYPEHEYQHLFKDIYPAIPNYLSNISFERGYEAMAFARAGYIQPFLDNLKATFGYWLKKGHTRFPENFIIYEPEPKQLEFYGRPFGLSLCHGANGAGMINAVIYGLFGFQQDMDHPGEYTVSPRLYGLKHMQGYFTVREGRISIQVNEDGTVRVDAPKGCTVNVR